MKHVIVLLSICILLFISFTAFSAVGSDYYTPLSVGNYISLHSVPSLDPSGWARTTKHSIVGTDFIAGKQYFKEIGAEFADPGQAWTSDTFETFWLRKDSVGNAVIGAMATTGSSSIDSATIMSGSMFPNEFLLKGYSRKDTYGKLIFQDSVVSTTETVTTSVGTFNNCIHIKNTHLDSSGTATFREDNYYAYRIGLIQCYRSLPSNQLHTDQLTAYLASGIKYSNPTQRGYSLFQIRQNSLNSSTKISFNLTSSSFVSLKVFDLAGRTVAVLVSDKLPAGYFSRQWNRNGLLSGVYFCRLQVGSFTNVQKLILHN